MNKTNKTKKQVTEKKRGSILAYSLVIISMMIAIATSMSVATILGKKSASATDFSVQAYQVADSGVQLAIKAINTSLNNTIESAFPGLCSNGIVSGTSTTLPAEASFVFSFFSGPTQDVPITACDALVNTITRIKSTGTYKGTVRTISVAVSPLSCSASTVCGTSCPYNGEQYSTIQIGTQCWFAENLRTSKKPDGTSLTLDTDYFCYTGDNNCASPSGNADANGAKYGALYTWNAAMGGSGICPTGWHLPADSSVSNATNEMWTLENSLKNMGQTCDGARSSGVWDCSDAGAKMLSGGSSGFDMPYAGYRNSAGVFSSRTSTAIFWSSTQSNGVNAWYRVLTPAFADKVTRNTHPKGAAFSVRCVKD